jgi:UDP-3-O-[3-hydroxymyristoyl] glucosamine N-acyltransferase
LAVLADLTGARPLDGSAGAGEILAVAPLGRADAGCVSFLQERKFLPELADTGAGACFVTEAAASHVPAGCHALVTAMPQAAYALAAAYLHHPRSHPVGSPAIHPDAYIEEDVVIGHNVVIGPGAKVGRGTEIGANAVIGPGVAIGRRCHIGANTAIAFALLGDGVRLLPGAVLGAAGFGVAASTSGAIDAPQLGRVILQDGVTVGACSCIDRGAFDDTVVGENTKIDNLVQIGHNVRIGRNCVLAAQTGIAGSVTVGDSAQFGGKAGVGDHLTLGDRIRVAAGALVMRDVPDGETWCGIPAKPIRTFMREIAWVSKRASAKGSSRGS